MASMMVDEPGNNGFNDNGGGGGHGFDDGRRQRRVRLRLVSSARKRVATTALMTVNEPGGSGFDSGGDGGGNSAGKRAVAAVASMMVGKPDDNNFDGGSDSGGSSKRRWEMGGGDNFDDGQKARRRLASRAGKQLRQWGIDRAKGDFVFLIFLSPLFDKK
uniref:Uncharacterized protein n=1 Tax=Oryza sativa subsp. japonica TaxID=39947 RepID=Q6ER84_ORYSJ|nr:hypothetical protein [Oryza sativa Japonica Group]